MTELHPTPDRAALTVHDGRSASTRTDQAVTWTGCHIGELAALGLPLLLAVTVSWWLAGLSVLAGAAWVAHEIATRRRNHTTDEQARPLQPVPNRNENTSAEDGEVTA